MERAFAKAEELIDSIKEYVNTRIESVKLSTAEKSSTVIANLIAGVVVAGIVLLFIIFVSIALSILIGIWLGTMWLGFLIMAGIYMLLGLVVWTARGKIIRLPVMNSIIQQLFKHDEED